MRGGCASGAARLPALACCLALLCVAAATPCGAASQPYVLQRRFGETGAWEAIATFAVARTAPDSPARLRAPPPQDVELTSAVKSAMAIARFVHYRLVPDGAADSDAVALAISPCSLVRGFEAVDARTVVLKEELRVAVGPGTAAVGLQASSGTNTFHAKMLDGDECDMSVLTLFPQVRLRVVVGLVQPAPVRATPDYAQLERLMRGKDDAAKERPRPADGDGATEEEEKPEDKRGFIEKYWMYFIMPIVVSIVQNVFMKN